MDVITVRNHLKKIKGFLIFFYGVALLFGCHGHQKTTIPILEYKNNRAVSVSFRIKGDLNEIKVYRLEKPNIPILGHFSEKEDLIVFTPVIPFMSDQEFGISLQGKPAASFKVARIPTEEGPEVAIIHPKKDTIPVNQLKIYLEFSEPMQHVGNPLEFIHVFDITEKVEVFPFLDLEAELWNKDHTQLTLWFDPGRIKTGLIPNKEQGLPLKENHSYSIEIDKEWQSATGIPLKYSYSKTIHVGEKDVKRPNLRKWQVTIPEKNTKSPLKINFNEVLDPILALEGIKLIYGGNPLSGQLKLTDLDRMIRFEPNGPWKVGEYQILVNPILEDMAGNTLQHPFDSDLRISELNKEFDSIIAFQIP